MKAKKQASPFARKFIEHCDKEANKIAQYLEEDIKGGRFKKGERESLMAFCLSDELAHFFYNTLRFQLSDPDGAKRLRTVLATRAGRVSGAKRWNRSGKFKFLQWALAENKRNPDLSKNAIAQRYANDNPGTSATTLRRYLSDIPTDTNPPVGGED